MKIKFNPKKQKLSIILSLIFFTGVLALLPFWWNNFFFTVVDAGGMACGAKFLAETGQFSDVVLGRTAGLGSNFLPCWTKNFYPALQILHAIIFKIIPFDTWILVAITTVSAIVIITLTFYLLCYKTTRSTFVALTGGIFAATSPSLFRAVMLTPQNVWGYLLLILILFVFSIIILKQKYWLWLVVLALFFLLFFTHTLSFGMAAVTVVLWFILFYLPSWKFKIIPFALAALITFFDWQYGFLPLPTRQVWSILHSGSAGYQHPLWDHPAVWGYIVTSLAALGIFACSKLHAKIKWLLLTLLAVSLLFGHAYFFSLTLLPERFIAFGWIPMAFFAAIGLEQLITRLNIKKTATLIIILLLVAQTTHAIIYMRDDYNGWSKRFQPRPKYVEALKWLNNRATWKGPLLGIMNVSNREISFAVHFYDGPTVNYPWYNLNHRDITDFTAKSSLYAAAFQNPQDTTYLHLKKLYTIVVHPETTEAKLNAEELDLKYFIVWKPAQDGKIWKKTQPEHFPKIYENEKYAIYDLQPNKN